MQGAIIGFGNIAVGHTLAYSKVDGLDIVAVVDPSPVRREYATRHFCMPAYACLEEMLKHENPAFIDICTPPSSHAQYVRLGLAHRLHVLCEKPVLVPDGGGYASLLEEIRTSDRVVYPCHNYKFAPILGMMQQVVSSPEFGSVLSARFRTLRNGHALGTAGWNPHWRRDPAISAGGILRDHGPHRVYLATHLTRRTPVAVSCLTGNLRRNQYTETEDTAMLTIHCEESVQITVDLTWSAGFRNSHYSIVGANGSVAVENDNACHTIGGEVTRSVLTSNFDDPSHTDWFRAMFLDFLDKLEHPGGLDALLRETLVTSVVIDSAYASAADGGRWVDVDVPAVTSPADDALR